MAYYIVKHNLNDDKIFKYLMNTAEIAKHYYKCGYNNKKEYVRVTPDYSNFIEKGGYYYDEVMKLVEIYRYEENKDNN